MTATFRRYCPVGLCLIILVLLVNIASAAHDIDEPLDAESQKTITKGVLNKQITIVPQLNKLNFGLGRYDGVSFYFKKSLSKIFFQDRSIEARVTDIEFEDMKIILNLFHPVLGDGTLDFVFEADLLSRITDADLQKILLTSVGNQNNLYVFADPVSKIYHSYTCLHTKNEDDLIRMTQAEAVQQGYRECSFCFRKVLYLPDLAVEKGIEQEWSVLLRDDEPLIEDSVLHRKMRDLGHRILGNWPLPLLGYEYSFHLVKSSEMHAIAMPTGKIFVSTALFEALENEQELEALLLLAIAHIELRHSLKQRQAKLAAAMNSDAIQQLVRAAGSVAGMFPGGGLIDTLGALPFNGSSDTRSSISEFGEDFNQEADGLAALYFDLHHGNRRNLVALIHKIQVAKLAEQLHPEHGHGPKDFNFNDRMKRVENTKFLYFAGEKSFVFKKKNQLPVELDLLYQSILENDNSLVVYISDRSLISDFTRANQGRTVAIKVQDQNGTQEFKLLEKFTTEDLWGARLTFRTSGKNNNRFVRDIKSITLELTNPGKSGDKRDDQFLEQLFFVKGRLEY